MQTLRHMVVGTDFSEPAEQAIDVAVRLALVIGAEITLVHVCELCADDQLEWQRRHESHEWLSRLVARHRHVVEVSGVLRSGKPWEKLDNVAAEVGAGLIVVGRRGAGSARDAVLGSVAAQLVRTANRHVLTVTSDFDRLQNETSTNNQ